MCENKIINNRRTWDSRKLAGYIFFFPIWKEHKGSVHLETVASKYSKTKNQCVGKELPYLSAA